MRIALCFLGHFQSSLEGGLAGEYQDADRTCIVSHGNIGVDSVSHHGYLAALKPVAVPNAVKHGRVRLSHHLVRQPSRGRFDALLERTAVHEDGPFIGRTDPVRIRRDVRNALLCPPCGSAES